MASCGVAAFIIFAVLSLTAAGPQSNANDDAGNTPFINNRCVDDEGQPQVIANRSFLLLSKIIASIVDH